MKELNQNSLTYLRGNTSLTINNFTPEKLDVEQLAAFGIVLVTDKLQDFVFDTSDLSNLTPAYPQRGDKITWGGKTFELMPIGDELYCFITSTRTRMRVHTRQIA
jgi:hypothetical protein